MIKLEDRKHNLHKYYWFSEENRINRIEKYSNIYAFKEYLLYTYFATLDTGEKVLNKNKRPLSWTK